jgi:hypothetical protein
VKVTPEGRVPEVEVVLVVNVVPSDHLTVIVELAAKLDPDTVTIVPTLWLVEVNEIDGKRVNVVDAVLGIGVAESENIIVLLPAVEDGTVNVAATKEPVAPVVVMPLRGTEVPPIVAVNAELAANPEPEIVTDEPTTPEALVGLVIVIEGITVKVAKAEFKLVSKAVKECAPAVANGI